MLIEIKITEKRTKKNQTELTVGKMTERYKNTNEWSYYVRGKL